MQKRSIVEAETTGQIIQVDKSHWTAAMYGRERQLLMHVVKHATEGDINSVLKSMDSFWNHTFSEAGSNSWSTRGDILDGTLVEKKPKRCVELGTYCGYSALRIARSLPEDGLLVTIDIDPLFAAIATKIIEYAGASHKVKVLMGEVETKATKIAELLSVDTEGKADFVLCDHSKDMFVPDLQTLEKAGVVGPGSAVMGDTTVYPGEMVSGSQDSLLSFFVKNPQYTITKHIGTQTSGRGGITVSEWVHLP
jgi:catechol O-methyltransferase